MTTYDEHATFPGARGGVWHLHHVPASRERPAVAQEAARLAAWPMIEAETAPVSRNEAPSQAMLF